MSVTIEDIVKILLAILAGGLIGIEREFRDKAAGFRTLIFICLGACLFTILSARFGPEGDPNRIAANIVTGVGFLGAGVILRESGKVIGLTTAATIWLTAAVGMGIGGGQYLISGIVLAASMIVLWLLPMVEHRIDNSREERRYEIVCSMDQKKRDHIERIIRSHKLKIRAHRQSKCGDKLTLSWQIVGSPRKHALLLDELFADSEITEIHC